MNQRPQIPLWGILEILLGECLDNVWMLLGFSVARLGLYRSDIGGKFTEFLAPEVVRRFQILKV